MSAVLDIRQLDFAYGEQLVLKQIDLTVEPATTLGVIGPNGGGKTTLLRLLLGLLTPTRGQIRIAGMRPVDAVRRGNVIGYLPQNPELSGNVPINVVQLVRLGLVGKTGMLRGHSRDDLAFVDHLVQRVGLADQRDDPVGQLSGGQLQRALIARALAPRPKILLLDEPTTGIDRGGQKRFVEFLLDLKRELQLTIVFVSHDLPSVMAVSDRVACLNVTLHFHDVPRHLSEDLAEELLGVRA